MTTGRLMLLPLALFVQACAGDDTTPVTSDGATTETSAPEAGVPDGGGQETATPDSAAPETSAPETGANDSDSGDGGCPSSWQTAPAVDPPIEVPADGGSLLLHASAAGTQNYQCGQIADGGYAWVFVGPEAELRDCNSTLIGHHFASDAGATAPEWQTLDGTYVIGHKVGSLTPDAGPPAIPWLLLQATSHGGPGTLSRAAYVQRLVTDGGLAPSTTCDQGLADGGTNNVPYTADYYFFGQ